MVLSCSDKDEPAVEPDVPVTPDVPLPPVPTPIRWVENEVDGGERGVGIKVTSKTTNNFVFECTPGDKVQSYRWMFILYVDVYYLFESGGSGASEEEIEDLILKALYNSEGAGAYTFNRKTLGVVTRIQSLTGQIPNMLNRDCAGSRIFDYNGRV